MNAPQLPAEAPSAPVPLQRRSSAGRKLLITFSVLFGLFGLTAASAAFWYHHNFHATLKPVALTVGEQQALEAKMAALGGKTQPLDTPAPSDPAKTIVLNEREINAWLQQQSLHENVQFHIRNGGFAVTVVAPVEDDTPLLGPFMGGSNVRLKFAFNSELDKDRQLTLSLADVSVAGISLPNAWLGEMKGVNLLEQTSAAQEVAAFQRSFAAGIKDFQLRNGEMRVVLND
jgi:hypothetical protein